jgi:hypothetical protein
MANSGAARAARGSLQAEVVEGDFGTAAGGRVGRNGFRNASMKS